MKLLASTQRLTWWGSRENRLRKLVPELGPCEDTDEIKLMLGWKNGKAKKWGRGKDKKTIIISWYIINQCAHSLYITKHININKIFFILFKDFSIIVNAINYTDYNNIYTRSYPIVERSGQVKTKMRKAFLRLSDNNQLSVLFA